MHTLERTLKYWPSIQREASAQGLDALVLAAVVCQESAGNALAESIKTDWDYRDLSMPRPAGLDKWTEWWGQARSYGLCQIMGSVARGCGFSGWWGQLFEPETNLHFGAKALAGAMDWAKHTGHWQGESDPVQIGLLKYHGGFFKGYPQQVIKWCDALQKSLAE